MTKSRNGRCFRCDGMGCYECLDLPAFRDCDSIVGDVIRKAVAHDRTTMRFYLTCSVGEVALRVALALSAASLLSAQDGIA